jgi:thioredoxin reductase (NADPH)
MQKPVILVVDDDPQVLRSISRDLKSRYRKDYELLSTSSAKEALELLTELKNQGTDLALIVSDQRMPEMEGVDFLEKAKPYFPKSKKVLLTAYSDTEAAIKAINHIRLDFYLSKPWDPPEEKLYPVLDELLDDWQFDFRPEFKGIKVVGFQFSPVSHAIKDFLSGHLIPFQWIDYPNHAESQLLLEANQLKQEDLPVVFFPDGKIIQKPSLSQLAESIGLQQAVREETYDVVIVGAGPAGLAAAVYGGSEGLKTLLIERKAPGGQAGTSSRIENYLGFPTGLSGAELTRRALAQAKRFGTEFISPGEVTGIEQQGSYKIIHLADGQKIPTKSVVLTAGVDYRKLDQPGLADLNGAGVYYGAANTEAAACKEKDVFIVGGGNSAGQAAMYLSQFAKSVTILIRKDSLQSTMSSYLIDQISLTPSIQVLGESEIVRAHGESKLEALDIQNLKTGDTSKVPADALYIFIGAKPMTEWLDEGIVLDEKGFIVTGRNLLGLSGFKKSWKKEREPLLLETSISGIFAAGDVRSGAMNRVASAVGEGAMAISFVHKYLAE